MFVVHDADDPIGLSACYYESDGFAILRNYTGTELQPEVKKKWCILFQITGICCTSPIQEYTI